MGKAELFINKINAFSEWEIGGSKTQGTAVLTEDFIERIVKEIYKDVVVFKMGSQQHPDFLIVPKKFESSIVDFAGSKRVTKGVLESWEESKHNREKIRLVRLEVKTGNSVYTLNDTFPEPSEELSEIYVLFSLGERKIFVTTSSVMAKHCHCNPSIDERLKKSKKTVSGFHEKLKSIWAGTGIGTAARPTYRMDKTYSHINASSKEIAVIFQRAGISD